MSATLNDSDFQCLQEQMVQLKTSHYELSDKYRKKSADFEAAMLKVHFLQKQLEEQERDFEITSTTLRREIEAVTGEINNKQQQNINNNKEEDYKSRYKKLLHKAKELQQRYEKSVEIVQQLDEQNKEMNEKVSKLEADNIKINKEYEAQLENRSTDEELSEQCRKSMELVQQLELENKNLQQLVNKFEEEGAKFKEETELRFESLAEQRKIQERKGLQIVKELKRQLALEKNRTETLQQRIENLLKEHPIVNTPSNSTSEQDANSVDSWSFVPVKAATKSDLSLCSIGNSEDRETVQKPCDTEAGAEIAESLRRQQTDLSTTTTTSTSDNSPVIHRDERSCGKQKNLSSSSYPPSHSTTNSEAGMLIEEQAALVDRLTKLQHDKWMLEEKLSYMEQANSSLSEDLANKSDIIKQYFMDQAMKVNSNTATHYSPILPFNGGSNSNGRRTSFPNNMNHLLSDKPSLKRVVDFLKERSQVSSIESENLTREATKKMQVMLEETLIKCLELQKNLDFVTSELNKLKS